MIGEGKVAGKTALPSCHWSMISLSVQRLASATRSRALIGPHCQPRQLCSRAPIGWREEAGIRAPRLLHWWAGKGGWAQRLVGGGPGLGRRGADWSESRLVVRHLGKAESRSGTEVPVYPRRTCRRRRRGIRVRVRARTLAASHGGVGYSVRFWNHLKVSNVEPSAFLGFWEKLTAWKRATKHESHFEVTSKYSGPLYLPRWIEA